MAPTRYVFKFQSGGDVVMHWGAVMHRSRVDACVDHFALKGVADWGEKGVGVPRWVREEAEQVVAEMPHQLGVDSCSSASEADNRPRTKWQVRGWRQGQLWSAYIRSVIMKEVMLLAYYLKTSSWVYSCKALSYISREMKLEFYI